MISKTNLVSNLSARASSSLGVTRGAVEGRTSFAGFGAAASAEGAFAWVSRLSDVRLALLLSTVLFALAAWPLALVEVPPLQDLPNHLAAITVIQHPAAYPDFVFNGFLKTNTALFAFLYFVGNVVGTKLASKLFVLLVLAANALVLPRFVLELTGSRKRMLMASAFAWPFIHNWFVSMGMLDFALGVPLSLATLALLHRQAAVWSHGRAALIAVLAVCTWYAHVFTLMVVLMLVGLHVLTGDVRTDGERSTLADRARSLRLFVPLIPGGALVAWSLFLHATEPQGAMYGYEDFTRLLPPWELAYNLWAEWLWGFTKLSITSLAAVAGLAFFGFVNRRERPTFFGPWAFLIVLAMYLFLPYVATNWFHVNSRLIPYLWVFALLRVPSPIDGRVPSPIDGRVPSRLDKRMLAGLGVCAALYSVGMGIDYVRLDRDRAEFTAGVNAVPKGSRLLPLIFTRKLTSENTRSILHAWGYYVMEDQTDAPLLFAHSRSFPVMYREPPPVRFNHLVLESFAQSMRTPDWMCGSLREGGILIDCDASWRKAWSDFWADATPRYDHVLLWDPSPEALALVPAVYKTAFHQGHLTILARQDAAQTPATASVTSR